MKVLAYMNSPRWNTMDRPAREQAIQCPCEGDIQDIKHVATECSYLVEHMDEVKVTVGAALQTEPDEAAQRRWLSATSMGERVAAIIGMDMRRVSPEVTDMVASGLKLMVSRMERELRTINLRQGLPVDDVMEWAPDAAGPQIELMNDQHAVVV